MPARRRFTVDEFERLAKVGVLHEDDRVELVDGDIVEMTPISSDHAGCVNELSAIFFGGLGNRTVVAVQNPVRLDDFNEPQPDLTVLRPRDDRYRRSHPGAEDVLLLIEAAHTSQRYDRGIKAPLYGRYGIPETWVVDLAARAVHVFRDPSPEGYRSHTVRESGESLAPQAFPDLRVEVDRLVGCD